MFIEKIFEKYYTDIIPAIPLAVVLIIRFYEKFFAEHKGILFSDNSIYFILMLIILSYFLAYWLKSFSSVIIIIIRNYKKASYSKSENFLFDLSGLEVEDKEKDNYKIALFNNYVHIFSQICSFTIAIILELTIFKSCKYTKLVILILSLGFLFCLLQFLALTYLKDK